MPGSNNDINVLDQSPLLKDLMYGQAPEITFTVIGKQYKMGYYLVDGIYPDWKSSSRQFRSLRVPSVSCLQNDKKHSKKLLSRHLAFCRYDVLCLFLLLKFTLLSYSNKDCCQFHLLIFPLGSLADSCSSLWIIICQ